MPFGSIFLVFLLIAGALFFFSHLAEKKRQEELLAFAKGRGWQYSPAVDRTFPRLFRDFESLQRGDNRYARHFFRGAVGDLRFTFCEYHYETSSTDSDGNSSTSDYWHTLLILEPPFPLKELRVRPEGIFDKLAAAFGGGDINFESSEFSRRFHVSAPDRSWAYAVIQPPVMDLLLRQPRRELAMNARYLMLKDNKALKTASLPGMLDMGTRILHNLPTFVKG